MGQNNANLIEDAVYTLVLRKLKHILVNGFYSMDEVRYEYSWDETASRTKNIYTVRKEDAVLRYFLDMKVINGHRIPNGYRNDEIRGNEADKSAGVWADWNNVDPAYREYEWVVLVYSIDTEKLSQEFAKFGLIDTGTTLSDSTFKKKSSPSVAKIGAFVAHKDGSVSYAKSEIVLKPSVRKLVHSLIAAKGMSLSYDKIVDTLWNDDDNTADFLDTPGRTTANIKKRIGSIVSEANANLAAYGGKNKHIVSSGNTSYRFTS